MPPVRRFRHLLRLGLLAAVVGLSLRLFWELETRSPLRPPDAPPGELVIPPGASAEAIGRLLQEQGLVRHPLVFRVLVLLARWCGAR